MWQVLLNALYKLSNSGLLRKSLEENKLAGTNIFFENFLHQIMWMEFASKQINLCYDLWQKMGLRMAMLIIKNIKKLIIGQNCFQTTQFGAWYWFIQSICFQHRKYVSVGIIFALIGSYFANTLSICYLSRREKFICVIMETSYWSSCFERPERHTGITATVCKM